MVIIEQFDREERRRSTLWWEGERDLFGEKGRKKIPSVLREVSPFS